MMFVHRPYVRRDQVSDTGPEIISAPMYGTANLVTVPGPQGSDMESNLGTRPPGIRDGTGAQDSGKGLIQGPQIYSQHW